MALITQVDVGFATFNTAYTRIAGVIWERSSLDFKEYVRVRTSTYVDKPARIAGLQPVIENVTNVNVVIEGITLQKLYDALKGTDEFSGAIDDL